MSTKSIQFIDNFYDSTAGHLFGLSAAPRVRRKSRQSTFYALGLLARNLGGDVEQASTILSNLIAGQKNRP